MEFSKVDKNVFANAATALYSSEDVQRQYDRYASLEKAHLARYGTVDAFISSPGRIELIGNHTDHNNGKVLCAAISVDTLFAVTLRNDDKVVIKSEGYDEFTVDLKDLEKVNGQEGTSTALVRGVADYFVKNGGKVGGFSASVTSDVFKGAGVSSSASFELAVAETFNAFYNDDKFDPIFKAKASQYAENYHFGKPCGLMDQSGIALGGVSYIDFEDLSAPKVKSFAWKMKDLAVVLVNTGGDHSDLTSHYAAIRTEMEEVASYFGKKVLRQVDFEEFKKAIPELHKKVSDRAVLRAIHYFEENQRVEQGKDAVAAGDEDAFIKMIDGSGRSSYQLLQNCYVPGGKEQGVPLALALAKEDPAYVCARVHGGGFGGTVLCFIKNDKTSIENFKNNMASVFGKENVYSIFIRNSGAVEVKL